MSKPTRYPSGVSTAPVGTLYGDYPLPNPFNTSSSAAAGKGIFTYHNDFNDLGNNASRIVTGAGTTFAVVTAGLGGQAVLTPGGAAVVSTIARANEGFQFVSGNKFWYNTRIKTSGVGAGVITRFGLQNGTGANTTNDSIYFTKTTTAGAGIDLVSTVATVETTLVSGVVASTTADTFVDVGFYYDGTDLMVFADDVLVARVASPTIGATGTTLTNTALTPFSQITPVATETLTLDYTLAAQEITR